MYYVYVYLNPLKNGNFVYDNLKFKFEPFYIGKGCEKFDRKNYHIQEVKRLIKKNQIKKKNDHINWHKVNTIKLILEQFESGPIIQKILITNNSEEALNYEIECINKIGRKDLNKGPLTNMTDGGESVGSYWSGNKRDSFTKEHREKLSKSLTGGTQWYKGLSLEEAFGKERALQRIEINRITHTGKKYTDEVNSKKARFDENHPRTVLFKFISPTKNEYYVLGNKGIHNICNEFDLNFNSVKPSNKIRICKGKQEGWITERIGIYKHFKNINYDYN